MKSFMFGIPLIIFLFISSSAFAQPLTGDFFKLADDFFKSTITNNAVKYREAKNNDQLDQLIQLIGSTDLSNATKNEKKAFYINAYNLLVINSVAQSFPINSVNEIPGFFDRKKHAVVGESITLNKLEKERLIKATQDPRLHFVLVCGAVDCPPIVNFAYTPEKLEQQMETQTAKALNNPAFIKVTGEATSLSKIFQWYVQDFGGNQKSIISFINKYRKQIIEDSDKIKYYEYNWQLNNAVESHSDNGNTNAANASRYVVSAAIPKGSFEIKLFNNLYSQQTGSNEQLTDRATFFTSTFSALYGISSRFNAGLEFRYRRVHYSELASSPFGVFNTNSQGIHRQGITGIGPKVRIAPFESLENFSIQSTLTFATRNDLAGNDELRYIDWNGPTFNTQFFNDFSIGNNFSLFTEIDLLLEDIGSLANNHANRFSTPATVIFSYFPNPKTTIYALGGFSPYFQTTFDYFIQGGFGAKYQISPTFEVELLYTGFTNKFLIETGGKAQTFNLGLRYNL